MKLLLFLDSWLLDAETDTVHRFGQPRRVDLPEARHMGRSSILYDPLQGRFRAWQKFPLDCREAALHDSADGRRWRDTGARLAVEKPQNFPFEQTWFFDPYDSDARRRYKMICWPYPRGIEGGPGIIRCSGDGIDWSSGPEYTWYRRPNGSDTLNNLFYNPLTCRWCAVCRPWNADRRVALAESGDLVHWGEPRTIVHPDSQDPPLTQFYGMPAATYEEEYFIGLLQRYRVSRQETRRYKMLGSIEGELVYSYDGQHWLRSDRAAFIPRSEPGTLGGGCMTPTAIAVPPEGDIHIFSLATLRRHGARDLLPPVPGQEGTDQGLVLHLLRRDGFAFLEPAGGWAQFTTRTLVPRAPELLLNYQAPFGTVEAQVCDERHEPLPGYAFADSVPLRGDEIRGPVRWKSRSDLAELVGRPVHLEFRFFDARIYAIRLDCGLFYTNTPEAISGP